MPLPTVKTKPKADLADYSMFIYGPPKIGKSEFASRMDNAVFLATEAGLNALEVFQVPINDYPAFIETCGDLAKGDHDFKTIVIDTIDNLYLMCQAYYERKYGVDYIHDLDSGKGSCLLNNEIKRVLTRLSHLPYGLVLISHAMDREFKGRTGRYMKTVPTLPDKGRKTILGLVDIIAYFDVDVETLADGSTEEKRVIHLRPSPLFEAGDRTGRLPAKLPLDYQAFHEAFTKGISRKGKQ